MSDGTGSEGSGFDWGLQPVGSAEPEPHAEPEATQPEPGAEAAHPELTHAEPTQAEPEATQLMDTVPPEAEATQLMDAAPAGGPEPEPVPGEPASAIDDLFGDTRFKAYEGGIADVAEGPFAGRTVAAPIGPQRSEPAGASRTQKILLGVVGGLVAVLALIALFFLGTRLPTLLGPAPAVAVSTPSATPSPTSTVKAIGPVANGVHPWTALLGGECLDPYASPWAETFTVVSCTTPHPAQMVYRGTFATTTDPSFPGVAKLQAQMSLLCAAPGVIDLAAAGAYSDAQVQGSYPVDAEQWAAGQHDYFCFVSRSSGQPLTASVAVPQVAAAPAPAP